jgi:hypothetical protein
LEEFFRNQSFAIGVIRNMRTRLHSTICIFVIAFFLLVLLSGTFASESDWDLYVGEFINFDIHRDFEIKITGRDNSITYVICDPSCPDFFLTINSGQKDRKFLLTGKPGYKVEKFDSEIYNDILKVEKRGRNQDRKHWREVFLSPADQENTENSNAIHVLYDDIPGELMIHFDRIINSIEITQPSFLLNSPKTL